MGIIKRYRWLLIVLTMSVALGGVAYAGYNVAIVASSPTDQWRACVSNTGIVRASTLRLNNYPPSCPVASDTVHSWNAVGPTGIAGVTGNDGPNGPTGSSGPSGATGERGLQASGPQTKLIYFSEVNTEVPGSGAFSPALTAVDSSACRSISAHWTTSSNSYLSAQVLDVEPISGAVHPLNYTTTGAGNTAGAAYPSYVSASTLQAITYLEWPTVDSGGTVGVATSLRFRTAGGVAATTVTKAWLRCVPF